MTLIALALGLVTERLVTNLLHLREPRWFDHYFDWGLTHLNEVTGLKALVATLAIASLPVLPVLLISLAFQDFLFGVPFLAFAVLVLLFSLGPRDLGEEIDEYCNAVERDDAETARRVAKELTESDLPAHRQERAVEEAIFVQANNRIFGVVFWFVVLGPVGLGPVGAWLFRVTDLMRRRAVFEAGRTRAESGTEPGYVRVVCSVHGVLAWVPARLLAFGYALMGSFSESLTSWRSYYDNCAERFFEVNDDVVGCAGIGAMGETPGEGGGEGKPQTAAVRSAMSLVARTLYAWVTVIAVLTLAGLVF